MNFYKNHYTSFKSIFNKSLSLYRHIHNRSLCFLIGAVSIISCSSKEHYNTLAYSVTNDSTLYYYNLGWKQIMDDGFYGPAEVSYRKSLSFDNDFLIGKATLARLTLDLDERLRLFEEVEKDKSIIEGDERRILDVYQGLVHFTNIREQNPSRARSVIDSVLIIAERNLRHIVHRYPEEIYLKSEYVEILNSNHGAQAALDSLEILTSDAQRENPFLLGFAASLFAEEGKFSEALNHAQRLKDIINDSTIPKSDAVYADVYLQMDSIQIAKVHVERAVRLDPRNLDASRIKTKIDKAN